MSFIQRGSKNRWVEYLQISLVSLGYSIGPYGIDGHFGEGTENAVYDFQADNGLQQDGKVGNDTWNAIKNQIKPIQEKLLEKGYNLGGCGADGIYGNSTKEAVKSFQKNNGLNPDGIAGPNTQDTLFSSKNFNILNPVFNPALLGIMGKMLNKKRESESMTNNLILNFDIIKNVLAKAKNEENDKFFGICNKISHNVFDFLKIEVKVTSYDYTYTCKAGCFKVTLNAKSGGEFKFEGEKYIFKNSSLCKTEGILLNGLNAISDTLGMVAFPQIKSNIETFKQKVGEAVVNGSVTIKFEFPKLIYEFEIAKKDDLSKLYGTFTISIEFDFNIDLFKIAQKIAIKVTQKLGNCFAILGNIIMTNQQTIAIIFMAIGIVIALTNPQAASLLLLSFA